MLKIRNAILIGLGLSTIFQARPTVAQGRPVIEATYKSSQVLPEAVKWINETCRPNAPRDIDVISQQPGPGESYYFRIFCRTGQGALGPVEWDSYTYDKNLIDPIVVERIMTKKFVGFIFVYAGKFGEIKPKDTLYYLKLRTVATK